MYKNLTHFRMWCQKVLPLIYDDSLSYYEVLCKVVKYINDLIDNNKIIASELEELRAELDVVQKWIDEFDTTFIKEEVEKYLLENVKSVVFGLTTSGYFVAYIPHTWDGIEFGTIQDGELYGHLTLSYD